MRREKKFVAPLDIFGSKSTISHFGERFRDGQYSLVSFLFAVLVLNQSINQSKHISIAPYVASESEAHRSWCSPCPGI